MKRRASLADLLVLCFLFRAALPVRAQDSGVADAYRFTVFPWYKLDERFTAYAHLAYSEGPDRANRTFNFVSPGVYYTANSWLQLWGGMINRYSENENSADQLELRPFLGLKLFVPNDWKLNLYNFTRYEHRAILDLDTHEWEGSERIRSRFAAEIPLTSRAKAWQPNTWYALVNVEPFYRFDQHTIDPLNVVGGIGYVLDRHVQLEFTYSAHFSRQNTGPLEFTENILRLNIKIGLNRERAAPGPTPAF